jgi:broad specificity phosphatase PhoE
MQIIVVRHGETDYNKTHIIQGQQQIPLNAAGRAQAREVAAILRQYPITHIYCSGLVRAQETAEIINKSFSLPIVVDKRLNERDWGVWENRNRDKLAGQNNTLRDIWQEKNLDANPHHGETTRELMMRVENFLKSLVANHAAPDVILVVTHGGPVRMMIGIIKGLADTEYLQQKEIQNGQIMKIRYQDSGFTIE